MTSIAPSNPETSNAAASSTKEGIKRPELIVGVVALIVALVALAITLYQLLQSPERVAYTNDSDGTPILTTAGASELADSVALLVSTNALTDAATSGEPFAVELAMTMRLVGDDDEFLMLFDRLSHHADAGVPTEDELIEDWATYTEEVSGLQFQVGNAFNRLLNYDRDSMEQAVALVEMTRLIQAGRFVDASQYADRLSATKRAEIRLWFRDAEALREVEWLADEMTNLTYLRIIDSNYH